MLAQATPEEWKTTEFYATDPADVREYLELVDWATVGEVLDGFPIGPVLCPCAGGSARDPMPYAQEIAARGYDVTTIDIRKDSPAEYCVDFLASNASDWPEYSWAVDNPPFSLYRPFVEKSLEVARAVTFLLPMNVLEIRKTRWIEDVTWWRAHRPHSIVTHPRMKFGGAKSSAFQQYAHFTWTRGISDPRVPVRMWSVEDRLEIPEQGSILGPHSFHTKDQTPSLTRRPNMAG